MYQYSKGVIIKPIEQQILKIDPIQINYVNVIISFCIIIPSKLFLEKKLVRIKAEHIKTIRPPL